MILTLHPLPFLQFAMENSYMYAFRERPEQSLGPGQLNSWISGKQIGESPYLFPFSVKDGYIRCHRLQNKKYRNLKNPQCITGIRKVMDPPVVSLSLSADICKSLNGRNQCK
jgi:hypothetical protein